MLTEIEDKRKEISENYGLQESMQLVDKMIYLIQDLLMVFQKQTLKSIEKCFQN